MSHAFASARLAIVGASVRAAAQSAVRAGFQVVGADLFADADLDGVCPITRIENYPEGLADWLAEQEIDAWMYTGALENYPELVDRMARIAPLWGVSGEALRRCRDPLVLQQVFHDAGLPFPETRRACKIEPSEPGWLAKTYRHSSGAGVWSLNQPEQRDRAIATRSYAQRWLPGATRSAVFAVGTEAASLVGMSWQQTRRPDPQGIQVGYLGSSTHVVIDNQTKRLISRLRRVLAGPLGLRGLIGVDLVGWTDHWSVIEINPRYTASVEVFERATGQSAVAAHAAACRGEPVVSWPAPTHHVAKRIVYAERRVTITKGLDAWMAAEQQAGRLADRPRQGEAIEAGWPICTLLAEGADIREAEDVLRRRLVVEVE